MMLFCCAGGRSPAQDLLTPRTCTGGDGAAVLCSPTCCHVVQQPFLHTDLTCCSSQCSCWVTAAIEGPTTHTPAAAGNGLHSCCPSPLQRLCVVLSCGMQRAAAGRCACESYSGLYCVSSRSQLLCLSLCLSVHHVPHRHSQSVNPACLWPWCLLVCWR